MSDTPRTDHALHGVWYRGDHGSAIPALCRQLEREIAELRAIFPNILHALGNGSVCSADSSVEFLRHIPEEVDKAVKKLDRELEQERQDRKHADLDTIRALGERNELRARVAELEAVIGANSDGEH